MDMMNISGIFTIVHFCKMLGVDTDM